MVTTLILSGKTKYGGGRGRTLPGGILGLALIRHVAMTGLAQALQTVALTATRGWGEAGSH